VSITGSNDTIGGTVTGARNVISGNQADGINVNGTGAVIRGNYIGTDVTGTVALGNQTGVVVSASSTIGGTAAGAGNVISGNQADGIDLAANGSFIQGNFIGVDVAGAHPLGNTGFGLFVSGSVNLIGGTLSGARNVISGNSNNGLVISGHTNQVQGNFIGTDVTGTHAVLPPGFADGILLSGPANTIGGTTAMARNLISGNPADGMEIDSGDIIEGNFIGTDETGTLALGNGRNGVTVSTIGVTIGGTVAGAGNVMSANQGNGIELAGPMNLVQGNFIGTDVTGTRALPNLTGMVVNASGNTVGGTAPGAGNLISGNKGDGIHIDHNASFTVIQGNLIGTDISGSKPINNGTGINVASGPNNLIGGTTAAARNTIAGNLGAGVFIETSSNLVQGNFIGTDISGTIAVPNQNGVIVTGSANTIGGTSPGAGNVIAGNGNNGLLIAGPTTTANLVQGNFIGTDPSMTFELGNGGNGVVLEGGVNNTIGGTASAAGNTIAFNAQNGALIDTGTGNAIRRNVIIGHDSGLGIALFNGGNNDQAFPILTSAVSDSSSTTVEGTLTSTPSTTFTIEFFADTVCNPSGYGEGERFLGSTTVTTNADGKASFTFTVGLPVDPGQFIAATATDPGNDTSSFSACVQVMPLIVPVAGLATAAVYAPTPLDVESFSVSGDSYPVNGQSCELDQGNWSEVVGTPHPAEGCIYAAWPVRETDPFIELGGFPCAAPL
jgi:titin